jgi:hypothetical protein
MRRVYRAGVIAVLTIGVAAASAFGGNVTVGRFYVELAKAKNLASADAVSAEANLRHAGYALPKLALDESLTEGDLKSISSSLGLTVKTEKPSAVVSETQLNTFMTSFSAQIAAPGIREGGPAQPQDLPSQSGKGKGKKKGHHKSASEPI